MHRFRLPFHIGGIYYFITIALAVVVYLSMRIRKQQIIKSVALALAVSYVFLVLSITVFSRGHTDFDLNIIPPFWAYKTILAGDIRAHELIAEIIMNVLMLAPLGFLAPFITEKHPILIGVGCSVVIELIQLVTKKGYFEIDDIIHNTIGILIGFAIYKLFRNITSGRLG